MNRNLGEINRGGGSIKVGSIGTISSLMNMELKTSSSSSQRNLQSPPVSVSCSERSFKLKKPSNESQKTIKQSSQENIKPRRGQNPDRISVMSLATSNQQKQKSSVEEVKGTGSPDLQWKTRSQKRTHHIPMLRSEDVALEKTSIRDKRAWKVNLVEVVDSNCGIPAGPLSSRLKKLSFAKLSQSII